MNDMCGINDSAPSGLDSTGLSYFTPLHGVLKYNALSGPARFKTTMFYNNLIIA